VVTFYRSAYGAIDEADCALRLRFTALLNISVFVDGFYCSVSNTSHEKYLLKISALSENVT
jgi:hypothetical protein